MSNICAMVLTFNRKSLLKDCLEAIQRQTVRCDRVIVVDNGGTDGTFAMLQNEYPWVESVRLRRNIGAAGGFAIGTRLAHATGADRVWIMDDDVICEANALEELCKGLDLLEGDGLRPPFIISTAYSPQGPLTDVPDVCLTRDAVTGFPHWSDYLHRNLVAVTRATLASFLLPRRTLDRYGYPLASMFIWGEDAEYTFRITKEQPGFVSGTSRVLHARTQLVLDLAAETSPARIGWHRHLVKNHLYTARKHRTMAHVLWRLFLEGRRAAGLLAAGQPRKALPILHGMAEGLWFRPPPADLSPDIDPALVESMNPALGSLPPTTGSAPAWAPPSVSTKQGVAV